jgi:hypothetical protein
MQAQKVTYIPQQPFGIGFPKNGTLQAELLGERDDRALLAIPRNKYGCGCIIIAYRNDDGTYTDIDTDAYVNITKAQLKKALGLAKPTSKK